MNAPHRSTRLMSRWSHLKLGESLPQPYLKCVGNTHWEQAACWERSPFFLVLTTPVQAIEVQIQPDNPQLGDTLSVIVQTGSANAESPTREMDQTTYPTFAIGSNRFSRPAADNTARLTGATRNPGQWRRRSAQF